MRRRRPWPLVLAAGLGVAGLRAVCGTDTDLRVATFNIENYPKSDAQEAGAFDAILESGAAAVAVQEITEPGRFADAARKSLGADWRFVWPRRSPQQRVGVLFDGRIFQLLSTRTHRETVVYDGAKPTFEARLRPAAGGAVLRLLVVHLKAGADGVDLRRVQLAALVPILVAARQSGDRVVLLGDFNSTSATDRRGLATLAEAADFEWSSEDLACTSYWSRENGCVGTALDHVLARPDVSTVRAAGPCETEGCGEMDRCPIFHEEVSDHCPVVVEVP